MLGAGFEGDARGRAIGTWAAAGAITGAAGPVIGGWLVDVAGWRTIFLLNLPLASGALWLALRHVDETRDRHAASHLDVWGALLVTSGLGALAWGLTEYANHGGHGAAFLAIGTGVLLLAAFLAVESRLGAAAMMPLSLFASRAFVGITVLTFCLYAALGGLLVVLPYFLIRVLHFDATLAGAAVLPLPIVIGIASRSVGRIAERTGPRMPLTLGPLVVAAGFAWLALDLGETVSYWTAIFPPLLTIAIGMALSVAPLTTNVMTAVDADHVGAASGVNNAVARVAGLLAVALIGVLFAMGDDAPRFVSGFAIAAWIGAVLAAIAGACGFAMVGRASS